MSLGLCKKCSGYPLEVIVADNMDIDRACLCFRRDGDDAIINEDNEPEENDGTML